MQYQVAKSELESPPAQMPIVGMMSEAVIMLVVAFMLAQLIGV